MRRIPGDHHADVRIFPPIVHNRRPNRIQTYIITGIPKCVAGALSLSEYMIMCAVLEVDGGTFVLDMLSQERRRVQLVRFAGLSNPDQMNMVGHDAVNRTAYAVTGAGVQQALAKAGVELVVQPAGLSSNRGVCPEDAGAALVIYAVQSREVALAFHRCS